MSANESERNMSEATQAGERAKPWLKQPGEVHDKRGVPIYPGDLIRSYHFKDRRGRTFYLYHTAVFKDGAMWMVPTNHLQPEQVKGGGSCLLSHKLMTDAVVISGHGPAGCLDYTDRKRVAPPATQHGINLFAVKSFRDWGVISSPG